MPWLLLPVFLLLLLVEAGCSSAPETDLKWVEVDLHLQKDGKAQVTYRAHWSITTDNMHGFYLHGIAGKPSFKPSVALLPGDRTVPLEIKPVYNFWDVLLAEGEAWGPGEATYVVEYETDLIDSKNVTPTSRDGESLMVFDWAAVQWDEALDHETVTVRFDSVPAGELGELGLDGATALGLMTEPFVNEQYLLT